MLGLTDGLALGERLGDTDGEAEPTPPVVGIICSAGNPLPQYLTVPESLAEIYPPSAGNPSFQYLTVPESFAIS